MLLGEHAVLHGRRAIVCAVDRRVRVRLQPRSDARVRLVSSVGTHETDLDAWTAPPAFRWVMEALALWKSRLARGFNLVIESDCPMARGFGSSAAVTVATLAAAAAECAAALPAEALLEQAITVIRRIQGVGSGADAAASVFGGALLYRAEPRSATPLPPPSALVAVFSGEKVPTAEVVRQVEERRRRHSALFDALFDLMDRSVEEAADALRRGDGRVLGELLDFNQGLMTALGVSTPALARLAFELRAQPGVWGAKISGAGLGDCVIGLGQVEPGTFPQAVTVSVAKEGVCVERDQA